MKAIKSIAAVAIVAFSVNVNAQSFIVYGTDGSKTEFQTDNVEKIEFLEKVDPYNGHDYVDLGLPSGIKWATMNIGATSREDYGDNFAWGETSGYKSGKKNFSLDTYKWYMSTTSKDADGFDITIKGYTKYVNKSDASKHGYDGFYDDKTVLELEDDAAHVNWGGSWRMPTMAELDELRTKCTWSWTSLNGKNGYKVTGPNGNYIFLPAAGNRDSSGLYFAGSYGYFWSSSLHKNYSNNAYYLYFYTDLWDCRINSRYYGRSVRAVCP